MRNFIKKREKLKEEIADTPEMSLSENQNESNGAREGSMADNEDLSSQETGYFRVSSEESLRNVKPAKDQNNLAVESCGEGSRKRSSEMNIQDDYEISEEDILSEQNKPTTEIDTSSSPIEHELENI